MRSPALLFFSFSLLASSLFACADTTTMCQSGAKMGTQCYNSAGQTTYSSPPSSPPPSNVAPQSTPMSTQQQR